MEILQGVVATYGPQDNGQVMEAVEAIEISSADELQQKIAIRDISFHTIMLVPSRIECTGEFTLSPHRYLDLTQLLELKRPLRRACLLVPPHPAPLLTWERGSNDSKD